MAYRMLLGRQGIERFGFLVDPKHTTLLGKVKPSMTRKATLPATSENLLNENCPSGH